MLGAVLGHDDWHVQSPSTSKVASAPQAHHAICRATAPRRAAYAFCVLLLLGVLPSRAGRHDERDLVRANRALADQSRQAGERRGRGRLDVDPFRLGQYSTLAANLLVVD